VVMSDRELAQLTFAYRIFDPDVDISYSTREEHKFRNNMATLGVTTMSAGSKTEPGGYATYPDALEQFAVSDRTSPSEVAEDLRALGREPVWKDWDRVFDLADMQNS
ncbi:MAG: 2-iminoacetate synthase ThiH, partial [Paramuribaculum sp.]|nr:2-iminoacetate synthase ThiH [Paramuribaculum sp.]